MHEDDLPCFAQMTTHSHLISILTAYPLVLRRLGYSALELDCSLRMWQSALGVAHLRDRGIHSAELNSIVIGKGIHRRVANVETCAA